MTIYSAPLNQHSTLPLQLSFTVRPDVLRHPFASVVSFVSSYLLLTNEF